MTLEEMILTPEEPENAAPAEETALPGNAEAEAAEAESQPMTEPEAQPVTAPAPVKEKKVRRKPHIALRILLQLLSLLVAVALFATTLAGALILDVQQLTSSGGIKQLIDAVLETMTTSAPAKTPSAAPYLSNLSNWTIHYDETEATTGDSYSVIVDENGNTIIVDGNGNVIDGGDFVVDENGNIVIGGDNIGLDDIPEDIILGGGSEESVGGLIDWIYDQIDESTEEELGITKEQVQTFVEESTFSDYLSDKLAGYADDFINGTQNTTITADEIMGLLEENEELLKNELNIELTPEMKEELKSSVEEIVENTDINNTIREEVFGAVEDAVNDSTAELGVDMDQIRSALQLLTSQSMRNFVIIINVLLIALLCLLNFYNIPAGLTWAAFSCLLSGGILQLPMVVLQNMPTDGASGGIPALLASFADVFQPIHNGVLFLGVGLLVVSIIWRFIRAVIRKVRAG